MWLWLLLASKMGSNKVVSFKIIVTYACIHAKPTVHLWSKHISPKPGMIWRLESKRSISPRISGSHLWLFPLKREQELSPSFIFNWYGAESCRLQSCKPSTLTRSLFIWNNSTSHKWLGKAMDRMFFGVLVECLSYLWVIDCLKKATTHGCVRIEKRPFYSSNRLCHSH